MKEDYESFYKLKEEQMPDTKLRTLLVRLTDEERNKWKLKVLREGKTAQGALRQLIVDYIADMEDK